MDRNEIEYNKHSNKKEIERTLAKRDRERYLRELSELEHSEASARKGIFWAAFSLLIIDPLFVVGAVWYLYNSIVSAATQGALIANLGTNVKYTAIGLAVVFTISSLTLLYHLWRVSSLKREIARVKQELYRLEKDLSRDF